MDHIWKALSDPTRRGILEFLRESSRTTTDVVENFPDLTRFNVMKHLDVLRSSGLVDTKEDGRRRINSINSNPLDQIYHGWLKEFGGFAGELGPGVKSVRKNTPRRISLKKKKPDFGWRHYKRSQS